MACNILQKAEVNIWKQCTALLALLHCCPITIANNKNASFFIIWDTAEDNPCFLLIQHQFWLDRFIKSE